MRLGLCCKFKKEPIRFRTTTLKQLKKMASKGCDPKEHLYTNELNNWFLAAPDIRKFEAACITQLIQVELLQRRFAALNFRRRLCQIPNF